MNKTAHRKRTVLRIRWREKKLGGITQREYEILQETKLYRTLRAMFPKAKKWQVHSAIRSMDYGRVTAVLRPVNRVKSAYGRGPHPDLVILDEAFNFDDTEERTVCVNDTNGDGDCAACARNTQAPCRQPISKVSK